MSQKRFFGVWGFSVIGQGPIQRESFKKTGGVIKGENRGEYWTKKGKITKIAMGRKCQKKHKGERKIFRQRGEPHSRDWLY